MKFFSPSPHLTQGQLMTSSLHLWQHFQHFYESCLCINGLCNLRVKDYFTHWCNPNPNLRIVNFSLLKEKCSLAFFF
jgi:hypothetical protein